MNDTVTRLARRDLFGRSAGLATIAALGVAPAASPAEADPKPREEIMTPDVTHALPVSHHTAELNGIRVHYVTAGTGEPVVLVHGFPQTWYAWRKIIPALAARYAMIAPDLRGCGDTDRPDVTFDKRTAAEDIHQLVRHLGVGPVNLVGHDVGTMVSYAYAATYRNQVRRLALMESALPGFGLEELYDADAYPRMYHLGLSEAPNGLAEALINGRELMFVSHFMRQQTYDPTGPDEDALAEYALRLGAPGALRCALGYFRSHKIDAEHNRESARTKLAMPVLTVGASLSFKDILAERTPELAERVRNVVIPDCGHYLAEEQPDRLAAVLLSFLGATA